MSSAETKRGVGKGRSLGGRRLQRRHLTAREIKMIAINRRRVCVIRIEASLVYQQLGLASLFPVKEFDSDSSFQRREKSVKLKVP